jgi:hypothetical protein
MLCNKYMNDVDACVIWLSFVGPIDSLPPTAYVPPMLVQMPDECIIYFRTHWNKKKKLTLTLPSFIIRSIHENPPKNHIGPSAVKILSGVPKCRDWSDEYCYYSMYSKSKTLCCIPDAYVRVMVVAMRGARARHGNRDSSISAQHSSLFNG